MTFPTNDRRIGNDPRVKALVDAAIAVVEMEDTRAYAPFERIRALRNLEQAAKSIHLPRCVCGRRWDRRKDDTAPVAITKPCPICKREEDDAA